MNYLVMPHRQRFTHPKIRGKMALYLALRSTSAALLTVNQIRLRRLLIRSVIAVTKYPAIIRSVTNWLTLIIFWHTQNVML